MKKLGIMGGIGPASTIEYCTCVNEGYIPSLEATPQSVTNPPIYSRRKTSSKIPSRFSVGSDLKSCRKVIFFSALILRMGSFFQNFYRFPICSNLKVQTVTAVCDRLQYSIAAAYSLAEKEVGRVLDLLFVGAGHWCPSCRPQVFVRLRRRK